jgi:hypothetical protein
MRSVPGRYKILVVLSLILVACGVPESAPTTHPPQLPNATPTAVAPLESAYPTPPPGGSASGQAQRPAYPLSELMKDPPTATPEIQVTAVASGPLLKDIWPAVSAASRTTTLIYGERNQERSASDQPTYTFWRAHPQDLTNREHVATIEPQGFVVDWRVTGEMSPNGEWIAYQSSGHKLTTLYVMKIDGSEQKLVAEGLSVGGSRGIHRFAWSSNGKQLAFIRYWSDPATQTFGQEFYIYRPGVDHEPQRILRIGPSDLVGWRDSTTLLLLHKSAPKTPLSLESINVETQEREVVTPMVSDFTLLSPDRNHILVEIDGEIKIFDLTTRMFTDIDVGWLSITMRNVVWAPDSSELFVLPSRGTENVIIISRDGKIRDDININIPYFPSSNFEVITSSPRNDYIVVCESNRIIPTRSSLQTYLYNIPENKWDILGKSACIQVFGWQ